MSRFLYTIQDTSGEIRSGSLEAGDEQQAVQNLQNNGYLILAIQSDTGRGGSAGPRRTFGRGRVKGRDLAFLAEQLATLLKGGVPLVRALTLLCEHVESKALSQTLGQVTREVASGHAMHQAFAKHPQVFNTMWVSLVESGELSGQLPEVLRQIANSIHAREDFLRLTT